MDLTRNKRRDHEPSEFSQQSILSGMDRFVQAVDNMDDVIMVPSRLLDMSSSENNENSATAAPSAVVNTDLYSFYNMLNSVKTELIWGAANGSEVSQKRRMSTVSLCSDSDVESESSAEFDSGIDVDEKSSRIATTFRQHLSGLFDSLHMLTESADYLTSRYQEEVGGTSD
uniref:Mid1-interacting protein 1 n=1 Tax=Strigamia maritima TaxID=126957 RepID=T1JFY3_STRMM